ncbi:hypothetical protein LNKW23_14960 [Paralimibaculum aggregatum]|uniref:Uncharacterized protein n=1 Tax=Paralimibaculum aggregatum TaxID=3036245 RepID=A0ABQ6LN88_9RHOB|nr:hypothetical protein [Limibaculum sp. NKW23]GMG82283.1 hypothetical protein LNKW23_14960 [Limibaculum sp. NKW23]
MRSAFLISIIGAVIAGGLLIYVVTQTDLLDFSGHRGGERTGSGGLTPAARRQALVGDLELLPPGETRAGVTVRVEAGGAVFDMPGGREVAVATPEGWELLPQFVILNEINAGFFLGRPGDDPLAANYVNFGDARRPLEPTTGAAAIAAYEQAAERIAEMREMPVLEGTLEVVSVTPAPDAVYACLKREDGVLFQYGTRFVGPLWVQVMETGGCPEDRAAISAQLDIAEAALAGNR